MSLQKLKWREENFCWQRMTWLSRNSSWLRKKQTWPCSDCAKKKWKLNEPSDSMPRDRSKISLSKPPNFHILTNSWIFLLESYIDGSLCFDHRDYQTALEDQKRRQQMTVDDAERSHAKHSKFLNQTMEKYNTDIIALKISTKYAYILVYQFLIICWVFGVLFKCKFFDRMQKRHEEENARYKENMRKKMEMLLKLKGDITANRVLIYSIHQENILKLFLVWSIYLWFIFNWLWSSKESSSTCTCSSQFWMFAVSVNRRIWKPYMPETRLPTKRPNRERRKNGREFSKREVTQMRFSSSERGLRSLNVRKRKLSVLLFCRVS